MTFADLGRYTRALCAADRADVFYMLPADRQREAWDHLAATWKDHRRRDLRDAREEAGGEVER